VRPLQRGDVVVRRSRIFRTQGTVVEVTKMTREDVRLLWVQWAHATTLPNPSLEPEDTLDRPVNGSAA
jgi:hypothetical protein